jgi:hypothetical protein
MAKTTKPQPSAPPVQAAGKIGLWGAPTCGKTTFLAALSIAAARKQDQSVKLFGANDQSTDFLIEQTARLTRHLAFPPPTDARNHLNWVLHMSADAPSRRFGHRRETVRYAFDLNFIDAPGGMFDPQRGSATDDASHLFGNDGDAARGAPARTAADDASFLNELASCDGLVLLFDPTKEWQSNDVFDYFYGTLMKIAQRKFQEPDYNLDSLPHYVAVCTTKFDHYDVYRKACERGFVSPSITDRRFFPKVSDSQAEDFFISMGKETPRGNADLVRDMLRRFFVEDRVQFFVSSAIGFRVDADGIFDDQDFGNVDERSGPLPQIRGPIYPVNVIEPLMWLGQKLAGGQ